MSTPYPGPRKTNVLCFVKREVQRGVSVVGESIGWSLRGMAVEIEHLVTGSRPRRLSMLI